jgi:hypothetical protein
MAAPVGNTVVTARREGGRMTRPSSARTGILIVRLWNEGHTRQGFRARLTQTLDSADPRQAVVSAASPEDVYAVVRTWVEAFVVPLEH